MRGGTYWTSEWKLAVRELGDVGREKENSADSYSWKQKKVLFRYYVLSAVLTLWAIRKKSSRLLKKWWWRVWWASWSGYSALMLDIIITMHVTFLSYCPYHTCIIGKIKNNTVITIKLINKWTLQYYIIFPTTFLSQTGVLNLYDMQIRQSNKNVY